MWRPVWVITEHRLCDINYPYSEGSLVGCLLFPQCNYFEKNNNYSRNIKKQNLTGGNRLLMMVLRDLLSLVTSCFSVFPRSQALLQLLPPGYSAHGHGTKTGGFRSLKPWVKELFPSSPLLPHVFLLEPWKLTHGTNVSEENQQNQKENNNTNQKGQVARS